MAYTATTTHQLPPSHPFKIYRDLHSLLHHLSKTASYLTRFHLRTPLRFAVSDGKPHNVLPHYQRFLELCDSPYTAPMDLGELRDEGKREEERGVMAVGVRELAALGGWVRRSLEGFREGLEYGDKEEEGEGEGRRCRQCWDRGGGI